jgi:hypothetical protein
MLKPTPNRALYIQILQRMTPAERLRKSWELTEATREMMKSGLRRMDPDLSDAELHQHYLERLETCHNRNY